MLTNFGQRANMPTTTSRSPGLNGNDMSSAGSRECHDVGEVILKVQADKELRSFTLISSTNSETGDSGGDAPYPFNYICRLGSDHELRNMVVSMSRPPRNSDQDRTGPALTPGVVDTPTQLPSEPVLSFRSARMAVATITGHGKPGHQFYFEYAEHCFLGDEISLKFSDQVSYPAIYKKLDLGNGLLLTYGQICGLGGDFYGTTTPISDGPDLENRIGRFTKAFHGLAGPGSGMSKQPAEATRILKLLQDEVDALSAAYKKHEDTAQTYDKLTNIDKKLQLATQFRGWDYPSYGMLAFKNWDHFGEDAQKAYIAGHTAALIYAVTKDSKLEYAYAMNAFADHFLQDSFSSGHLRTPRRDLHGGIPKVTDQADWCAKRMHDEDCAIGLAVENKLRKTWTMYGDKQLLQDINKDNLQHCSTAVQTSANEVFDAWSTKKMPSEYRAWDYAPTLESARGDQKLAPLVLNKWERRLHIRKRAEHKFTKQWSYRETLNECDKSGLWKYPIRMTE